jgi:hypothetical protein
MAAMGQAPSASGLVPVTRQVTARRSGMAPAGALALVVLGVLLAAGSVLLYVLTHQNWLVNGIGNIAVAVLFEAVGFAVVSRQPGNPIGWVLLAAPIGAQLLPSVAASYAELAYRPGHHLPFGAVALLLEYSWTVAAPLLLLVILLFPDGQLPSLRWRPVLWAYLVLVACIVAARYAAAITALAAPHVRVDAGGGLTAVDLPAGGPAWYAAFGRLIFPVLIAFWVSFVAAQVLSWRRSSGERRQQLKWLMSGAAALAASQAISQPVLNFNPGLSGQVQLLLNILLALGAAALPACLGIAILKYRLYEIDRIISRTLAYAIVTGLLVGVYWVLVLLATRLLPFSGPAAVAGSTLAAAALFNPLRQRVQRVVDRRFNRARYDAAQTTAAFAARLKDAVDLDSVRDDLAGVVHQALEPAHISVWISQRD